MAPVGIMDRFKMLYTKQVREYPHRMLIHELKG